MRVLPAPAINRSSMSRLSGASEGKGRSCRILEGLSKDRATADLVTSLAERPLGRSAVPAGPPRAQDQDSGYSELRGGPAWQI